MWNKGEVLGQWRVYHNNFREFVASKDAVKSEHVRPKSAHEIVIDVLWRDLFRDEDEKSKIVTTPIAKGNQHAQPKVQQSLRR